MPQPAAAARDAGVHVALDDFGTGYSSLTHLQVLPVDVVKIDRSFVERVVLDGPDRRIVAAVTDLATGLGLDTVAEGIETASSTRPWSRSAAGSGRATSTVVLQRTCWTPP